MNHSRERWDIFHVFSIWWNLALCVMTEVAKHDSTPTHDGLVFGPNISKYVTKTVCGQGREGQMGHANEAASGGRCCTMGSKGD